MSKVSEQLLEQLENPDAGKMLDVVIELHSEEGPQTREVQSRSEKIAALKENFLRDVEPVEKAVRSVGGELTGVAVVVVGAGAPASPPLAATRSWATGSAATAAAADIARVPIMVGGGGERKTLRLVAQYADACNVFGGPERIAARQQPRLRLVIRATRGRTWLWRQMRSATYGS